MKSRTNLNIGFWVVSLLIVLSDLVFIGINYNASYQSLQQENRAWARKIQEQFELSLQNKSMAMQQLARYIANDPRVISLFKQGKEAVLNEGGGPGKTEAAAVRQQLYELVQPGWMEMTREYDVRQLHFHLGPGSTSFLRVHSPDRFGDTMDDVRYTVVDVNRKHRSTLGFETGRVYSGIRGVVPVCEYREHCTLDTHIGALEAGTSFTVLLESLSETIHTEFAVLLTKDHVESNMWADFINDHFPADRRYPNFYVEATTSPFLQEILNREGVRRVLSSHESVFLKTEPAMEFCAFPLRDYRGTQNPEVAHAGTVLAWRNAEGRWQQFQDHFRTNLIYALITLILIELVLYISWKYSSFRLRYQIETQTSELTATIGLLKENEEKLSQVTSQLGSLNAADGLTGIPNRRSFDEHYHQAWKTHQRKRSSLALLLCDIDYFKRFNDHYGHPEGDECLKRIAACLDEMVQRPHHSVYRYGGEEFAILLSHSTTNDAVPFARRIQEAVRELNIQHQYSNVSNVVTLSIGIAALIPDDINPRTRLIHQADTALHQAKEQGRNGFVVYSPDSTTMA